MLTCECGCGGTVTPGRRFISGHNGRGKKRSAETRRKLSEGKVGANNPNYGKPAWNRKEPPPRSPCGCGCGELAGPGKKYVSGHNSRVAPPKKPGAYYLSNGYRMVKSPDHPTANIRGYVCEHRLIAERDLIAHNPTSPFLSRTSDGRVYLNRSGVVHHINGDKQDNRTENLQVLDRGTHAALHHAQGDIRGNSCR